MRHSGRGAGFVGAKGPQRLLAFNKSPGTKSKGQPVLGACYFSPQLAIFIDPSLAVDGPRFRFTLAHELGHLTLHRALSLDFTSLDASPSGILDGRYDLRMGRRRLESPRDWLEWQANSYAASLLMPRATFVGEVSRVQGNAEMRRAGQIYVDNQPDNIAAYNELFMRLAFVFQTSRTAVRIRLTELSILKDRRGAVGLGGEGAPVAIGAILARLLASGDIASSDAKSDD